LLNDILDFSKIEAGKLELESIPFLLRDCVEKTGRTLAIRAAEKDLELACRIDPNVPDHLVGDPGRLRQILVNLAGNALKFTEQGEIVINVVQEDLVQLDDGGQQTVLHFSVRDTGIGIAEEKQAHIFDSFSQVDASTTRKYGGTGLGLAISSQLVAMMNGRIWVESEMGRGTTFHFVVQLGISDQHPPPHPAALEDLTGLQVLVVDDNRTNRHILEDLLAGWKLKPSTAVDGPSAMTELRRAADAGKPYQLVLLDCMMPDMDGFEVAQQIFGDSQLRDVTTIMISSAARSGDSQRCRELGIVRYMTKPIVQSELLETILQVMVAPDLGVAAQTDDLAVAPSSQLRVLMAEDGLVNQRVAVGLLSKMGHQTRVVKNGLDALEAWRHGHFDVILMDLQMPEMDGIEATIAIRAEERASGAHIPIIAMTAAAMKGDRERCLESGMDDYISKPINSKELAVAIERVSTKQEPAASHETRPRSAHD
jgi:CheY-like chemotaxis protein